MTDQRATVLLVTSNGTGMGHLSRQLTIALSGRDRFDAVILSLSGALARVQASADAGAFDAPLRFEYCANRRPSGRRSPSAYLFNRRWTAYLRDRVTTLAAEVGARAVVFDGVIPYDGIVAARRALPDTPFVWVRRGMWQSTAPTRWLGAGREFDLIIEPGDLAPDHGPTSTRGDAVQVAPICLDACLPRSTRAQAREVLGLPADGPVLLLAPGAGAVGSVDESARLVIETMRRHGPQWTIAVTRQAIAQHSVAAGHDDVVMLDDVFPLVPHLAAFDAAVSAAGYNAVHELLRAAIPTVLVPSRDHTVDDQVARARGVVERGWAIAADPSLPDAVARLLNDPARAELRRRLDQIPPMTGGAEAAALIAERAAAAAPAHAPDVVAPRGGLVDVRARLEAPPTFRTRVSTAHVRTGSPVEHLIDDPTDHYRRQRELVARQLYRWPGQR